MLKDLVEKYYKLSLAQTIPPEPEEEPIEKEQPTNAPKAEIPEQTHPGQYSLKFPEERLTHGFKCQYKDATWATCPNFIGKNEGMVDSEDGLVYCQAHGKACFRCGDIHSIDDMLRFGYGFLCRICFDESYMKCPNCKDIINKEDYLPPNRRNRFDMKNGGCNECSIRCYSCGKITDKSSDYSYQGDEFCEDCYSEKFTSCEECSDIIPIDDAIYVADVGDFCRNCYDDKFATCDECKDTVDKDDTHELGNETLCENCYEKKGPSGYSEFTKNFSDFSYTKKDRYLNQLYKMLPISIKELKSKNPSIAAGLQDLISFSKGKPLTNEIVGEYRQSLKPEDFDVEYSVWDGVQRSIESIGHSLGDRPQLTMNIIAGSELLAKLKANPAIYDFFDKINLLSKKSTHPYAHDQVGWARIELDPKREYILVDEIQSDHMIAAFTLNSPDKYEIKKIRAALQDKYKLTEEQLNSLLSEYITLLKDFPNIAIQAINIFARKNNFKKIFWHTYEGGKKLKDNDPPKSLYDKIPRDNFFLPTQEKPFGLDADFLEKDAKKISRLFRYATLYMSKIPTYHP
jgi:hypothetical protein